MMNTSAEKDRWYELHMARLLQEGNAKSPAKSINIKIG